MPVKGRFTGCDLGDTTPLFMPWTDDEGLPRPFFSCRAARISLELAATAYDLEVDSWREAGWRDFSYLVDDSLFTGGAVNYHGGKGLGAAISEYFQRLALSRIRRQNPISQLRGALRQREGSDTCKALIMLHPASGGRYLVAIGFMGTGKRIYDWFSNFRMSEKEGVHAGFLQLTQQFESHCNAISFPETARELGKEKLTLSDILDECRRPGSRFRIWMAGHSQGGAVMQLAALRTIQNGFLRQNLIGYGFASPSVIYENQQCDLSGIPLFHILNSDDVTPRLGAALHAGKCCIYAVGEEMQEKCYASMAGDSAFFMMLSLLREMRDNPRAMLFMLGLLHALEELPDGESMEVLTGVLGKMLPEKLLGALGGRFDQLLIRLSREMEKIYLRHTGEICIPSGQVDRMHSRVKEMIANFGPRTFVSAFLKALSLPHKLKGTEETMGAYQFIVREKGHELRQMIWCGNAMQHYSVFRDSKRRRQTSGGRFARYTDAKNKRK